MNATEKKEQVSLRLSKPLVDKIKEIAEEQNSNFSQVVEETLEARFLKRNKYQIMKEAEQEYMDKVGAAVQAPVEYLLTNGTDWLTVDSIESFPIDKEDYVFQCSVNDGNVEIKLITQH
jgi:predicted transcriptional regulator